MSVGVLPAYAGMIRRRRSPRLGPHRAPRVCGDDPAAVTRTIVVDQCSPRMRG